jgi:hypothetical protein
MAQEPTRQLATIAPLRAIDEAQMTHLAEQLLPKWPKELNQQQALDIARVAIAYGLDPFLEELIPYQGKPYITIQGRIRIADQHPAFDGYDLEPASGAEVAALRAHEQESVWRCTVYRKDRKRPTVGYGRAGGPGEQNPVARRWLPEIAQKRALHRALRAAFPIPIPGLEEHLSPEQLRAIHAYDRDLGISDDERHEALADTYGVETSADLTSAQASTYIEARAVEIADTEPDAPIAYFDSAGAFVPPRLTQDIGRDISMAKAMIEQTTTPRQLKDATAYIRVAGLDADPEVAALIADRETRAKRARGEAVTA